MSLPRKAARQPESVRSEVGLDECGASMDGNNSDHRLVVRSGGCLLFLSVFDIDWIEGEGNYVRIHMGRQSHIVREGMNRLQARLDQSRFLRIHRSTIVNADRIQEIRPLLNGAHVVILRDGTRLTWSRGHRDRLRQLTGSETVE